MPTAVQYTEQAGSPNESFGEDEFTASRTLICPWSQRHTLLCDLISTQELYPYNSPGVRARAVSGTAKPFGTLQLDAGGTNVTAYEKALVTVNYSTKSGDENDAQDLISESLEPNIEFLTCDHNEFCWGSASGDKLKENEAPGRQVRSLDYVFTIYNMPSIPAAVLGLCGCVNNAPVTAQLLGLTFPTETLLYTPPQLSRTITTDGTGGWQMQFRFSYRPNGWNKYWRHKTQTWERIYLASGGTYYNYPLGDFTPLLGSGG